MKRIFTILILLWAFSCIAEPHKEAETDKSMHQSLLHNGTLSLQNSNYGYALDLQYRHIQKLVYASGSWISGKIQRRDELGRKLYWLTYPPTYTSYDIVYEGHELWNPDLVAVQDTLTSVAYDGDSVTHELLPAYNPLLASNPNTSQLYNTYNHQDRVLQSIMGNPAPLPFDPFESENFCFSIPQSGSFETPGFITHSAYYYDYCPFGTEGQRYVGNAYNHLHYPLGIAVHSESYAWNLQGFDRMIITKNTIYNTNAEDSIEDLAISYFMDADIGPTSWGAAVAMDDVSGYVRGQGYEFAYSRDADGDGGLSPLHIASKLVMPDFHEMGLLSSWFWRVGQGPDDSDPLNWYTSNRTVNEKYWLATGRNPNSSFYISLRPEDPDIMQYEQPVANDTRSLVSLFGEQPGSPQYDETDAEGNYFHRLNLEPGASISYYTVLFVGDSIDDLKARSVAIEDFILAGMQIEPNPDLTSIPYLQRIQYEQPNTFNLNWFSYTDPHHFEVAYKEYGAPASSWNITTIEGDIRAHSLSGMDPATWYEVKVAAIYNHATPQEVYLESDAQLVNLSYSANADEPMPPPYLDLTNYPNPFRGATTVHFDLPAKEDVRLEVYNLKGQKVRALFNGTGFAGGNSLHWDGKDDGGRSCASGIYYLRMKTGKSMLHRKMLLLK